MTTKEKWYNPQKMLSYNQYLNFVIGGRGIGKTFAIKKHLLKRFIEKGHQFIYLRRNKSELDRIDKDKFFTIELLKQVFEDFEILSSDASKIHTRIEFKASNMDKEVNTLVLSTTKVILNGQIVCYMKSLSTWVDLKGSEYDEVMSIMYDEVLIDPSSKKRYLDNEVEALLNFIFSVFRRRKGCHVYLLSNAGNFNNPYFAFLKFYDDNGKRFYHLKEYATLIEFPPNSAFETDEDKQIGFFKLLSKSKIYESVANNEFQIKSDKNITKIKGVKQRLYSFYVGGTFLTGYYVDNMVYIAKGFDKNLEAFCLQTEEVEDGFIYLHKTSHLGKNLKRLYLNNMFLYEDIEAKNKFMEIINHVI